MKRPAAAMKRPAAAKPKPKPAMKITSDGGGRTVLGFPVAPNVVLRTQSLLMFQQGVAQANQGGAARLRESTARVVGSAFDD